MKNISLELKGERLPYEWFAVTLKSIGDAVIATNDRGIVIFINDVARTLTGWREDGIGKPLSDVFNIANEKTGKKPEDPVKKVLQEKKVVGLANHTILISKDDKKIPIDDSAAPIMDSKGQILGVILVFRDITKRREGENALRRLAAIIESSDDAIYSKALDGTVLSWNKGAEKIYGYSPEEIIGRNISIIVPPDRSNELPEIYKRLERGEYINHFETKRRRKDGKIVDISLSISPIKDEEGNIVGVCGISRDISEHKKMDSALRESEEKHRLLFTESRDAIMTAMPEEGFISGNPAAIKMFGCRDEKDFTSRSPAELSPKHQPDGALSIDKSHEMMKLALEKGSNFFEWVHKRINGEEFPATVLLSRIGKGDKAYLQATVRDITELKKAQKELTNKIHDLEIFNKIAVERELKMIELKKKIETLEAKLK